jgi:hypothetical protein
MSVVNTINGTYTLDETSGIQNGADATPSSTPRADSDITLATLQADAPAFYTYLFTTSGLSTTFPTNVGVAESSTSLINVQDASGGAISSIGLTTSTGGSFDGTQSSGIQTANGDHTIYLVSDLNNQVVLGKYDSDGNGSLDSVAFAVYMKPDGALDSNVNVQLFTVTFTALEHTVDGSTAAAYDDALDLLQNVYLHSTGQLNVNFDNMPSSANLFNDAAESASGGGIIVFGRDPVCDPASGKYTNASDTIHTSQGGDGATIGVNNQMFDPTEGAYFTFVRDILDTYLSGAKGGLSSTEADYQQNMQYDSLINSTGASVRISQTQGNDDAGMTITAYHLASAYKGSDLITHSGENKVNIDAVYVWDSTHTTLLESYTNGAENDLSTTIGIDVTNGVASVTGLNDGNIVEWHTVSNHNQVLIEDTAGAWDLGGFGITEGSSDTDSLAGHAFVEDSGPSFTSPVSDGYVHFSSGASDSHSLNLSMGTDTPGSYAITSFDTSLTLTGVTLTGADAAGTGQTIQYFQDANHDGVYNGSDVLYYTMSLTPAGSYTFTVNNAPAAPDLTFHFDNMASGDNLFNDVADSVDGPGLIVFGEHTHLKNGKYDNTSDVIATSQGGINATIGVNSQMFDAGEGAYFTIVNNITDDFLGGAPNGLTETEADYAANIQYATLFGVTGAKLGISQLQGNDLATAKFTAYSLTGNPQGATLLSASHSFSNEVDIAHVVVYDQDGTTVLEDSNSPNANNSIVITFDATTVNGVTKHTATVAGLDAGDIVKIETAGGATFNQVLVDDVFGKFDVGSFGLSQPQAIPDQTLHFTVTATDQDGDTASDAFVVNVDAVPFYA